MLSHSPEKTVNFLCAAYPAIGRQGFVEGIDAFFSVLSFEEVFIPRLDSRIKGYGILEPPFSFAIKLQVQILQYILIPDGLIRIERSIHLAGEGRLDISCILIKV